MNWLLLVPVALALIALIIFIIKRNKKDEKEFEQQMNEDYPKPKADGNDVDTGEEVIK